MKTTSEAASEMVSILPAVAGDACSAKFTTATLTELAPRGLGGIPGAQTEAARLYYSDGDFMPPRTFW